MAQISMDLVKTLREKTGVGMMDCKKALEEANGDMEKAIEVLRKKGTAVAAKRADNVTNNGRIESFVTPDYKKGAIVEIACETDFAAKTDDMFTFATQTAQALATNSPVQTSEQALALPVPGGKSTLQTMLTDLISKIAEKIHVNRFAQMQVQTTGLITSYIHPGSTVGVMIELTTEKDPGAQAQELASIARDVCMQIAVTKPLAVKPEDLDQALIQKEKEIARDQLKDSNKPAQVIDKIIEGKIKKFYEEVCLVQQPFIKNDKVTIDQYITEASGKLKNKISIKQFVRFGIGR